MHQQEKVLYDVAYQLPQGINAHIVLDSLLAIL